MLPGTGSASKLLTCMQSRENDAGLISGFALHWARALLRGGTPSGFVPQLNADGRAVLHASSVMVGHVPRDFVLIVTAASSQTLHLLCIDPETLVGDALHKILTTAGYRVTRAQDLESALHLLSDSRDRIDVVISDHEVPPASALDVLRHLQGVGYRGRTIVYSDKLTPAERVQYSANTLDAVVEKKEDAARLLSVMKALHGEQP